MEQLIGTVLSGLMGQQSQQQPQVTINNNPAPIGGFGDLEDDRDDELYIGSLDESVVHIMDDDDDDDFGDMIGDMMETDPGSVPPAIGAFGRRRKRKSRKALTGGLNELASRVGNIAKTLNNAVKINKRQGKQIRGLHRRVKETEERAIKDKNVRAALAAAVALPGVRAYSVLSSTQHHDFLASVKKALTPENFTAVPAYSASTYAAPADATAAQTNALSEVASLAATVQTLTERVNSLQAALAASEISDTVTDYEQAATANALVDIAKITPSQLVDRDSAILEGGIKYFFGRPSTGGSLLSLSI